MSKTSSFLEMETVLASPIQFESREACSGSAYDAVVDAFISHVTVPLWHGIELFGKKMDDIDMQQLLEELKAIFSTFTIALFFAYAVLFGIVLDGLYDEKFRMFSPVASVLVLLVGIIDVAFGYKDYRARSMEEFSIYAKRVYALGAFASILMVSLWITLLEAVFKKYNEMAELR
jgi:hypothetical protein